MDSEKIVNDFIQYYKSIDEKEKFKLGGVFNRETGGKLSPYDSPSPVSVGLIQILDDDNQIKLLGVRRNIMPKIGEIALFGGFVNCKEDAKDAVKREGLEELGLDTSQDIYTLLDTKITPGNQILMFYLNETVYPKEIMKKLVLNSEVSEFVLIDRDTPLAFPLHKEMCNEFFNLTYKPSTKVKP